TGRPASAQSVTNGDIQRLQDSIYDAARDVSQLRGGDSALASQLQGELDDLRDETVYLKVKLRKNEPVARSEYSAVRDRIDNVRSKARGETAGRSSSPAGAPAGDNGARVSQPRTVEGRSASTADVPVGTELDVRLQRPLS